MKVSANQRCRLKLTGLSIMAGVLVVFGLASCGSSSAAKSSAPAATSTSPNVRSETPLRIGYIPSMTAGGAIAAATANGWWNQSGIKPTFTAFTTGPAQTAALIGGSLDLINVSAGPALLSTIGHGKAIAVDCLPEDGYIIARPNSGVVSLADLKGKKVGFTEGTITQLMLANALKQAHLTMNDISAINMQPATEVSAYISGQIDVAAIYLPFSAAITSAVPGSRTIAGLKALHMTLPQFWVASNHILATDPGAVKDFLKVLAKGQVYRASHLQQTVADLVKFSKAPNDSAFKLQATAEDWIQPSALLKDYENGSVDTWTVAIMDDVQAAGIAKAAIPPVSSYTDFSLDTSVLKQAGY